MQSALSYKYGSTTTPIYALLLLTIFSVLTNVNELLPFDGATLTIASTAVFLSVAHVFINKRLIRSSVVKRLLPLLLVSVLLTVWAAIVYLRTDTLALVRIGTMGLGIGILFAVYVSADRVDRIRLMMMTIVVVTFASALFGLGIFHVGEPFWSLWLDIVRPSYKTMRIVWLGRNPGLSVSPGAFAYQLVVAIPLALAMLLYNPLRDRVPRRIWYSVLCVILGALIMAMLENGSRSLFLGVICGAIVVIAPFSLAPIVLRWLYGIGALIFIGAFIFIAIQNVIAPFEFQLSECTAVESLGDASDTMTRSGSWDDNSCRSLQRAGGYAQYYSFTLRDLLAVTIELDSSAANAYLYLLSGLGADGVALELDSSAANTYLYLLSGLGADGVALAANDNAGPDSANARITRTLDAGRYTVEATTDSLEAAGNFTLLARFEMPAYLLSAPDPAYSNLTSVSDMSARARPYMAAAAIRYALDHPLGTGRYFLERFYISPNISPMLAHHILSQTPHNQFLVVLVYYGLPGLILLALLYLTVLRSLIHSIRLVIRHQDTDVIVLLRAGMGGITGYVVQSLVHNAGPFVGDWYHFFMIGLVFSVQRVLISRHGGESEPSSAAPTPAGVGARGINDAINA